MQHAVLDVERIKRRMLDVGASQDNVAAYLDITQSTLSKKLRGKSGFTFEEGVRLLGLLGWEILREGEAMRVVLQQDEPAANAVRDVLVALPLPDRHECYMMFLWGIEGRQGRLKPEGEEALRALKALV